MQQERFKILAKYTANVSPHPVPTIATAPQKESSEGEYSIDANMSSSFVDESMFTGM